MLTTLFPFKGQNGSFKGHKDVQQGKSLQIIGFSDGSHYRDSVSPGMNTLCTVYTEVYSQAAAVWIRWDGQEAVDGGSGCSVTAGNCYRARGI